MMLRAPNIDNHNEENLLRKIRELAPFYAPQWNAAETTGPGAALSRIFAGMMEGLIQRLNGVPDKHFIAFLDTLGVKLVPPKPARVPMTFVLAEGARKNVFVPERTQMAAGEILFETEKAFVATAAKVAKSYSVRDDEICPAPFDQAFELFNGENQQFHILYLGDSRLFNIQGTTSIKTSLPAAFKELTWEFGASYEKGEATWKPLIPTSVQGKLVLLKAEQGEIAEFEIPLGKHKIASRWLRCWCRRASEGQGLQISRSTVSLTPPPVAGHGVKMVQGIGEKYARILLNQKPPIATIEDLLKLSDQELSVLLSCSPTRAVNLREAATKAFYDKTGFALAAEAVQVAYQGFLPDLLFYNDMPLLTVRPDGHVRLKAPLFPLGKNPRPQDCFYVASQEAFSKQGAQITFHLAGQMSNGEAEPTSDAELSLEYWDGKGWAALSTESESGNFAFGELVVNEWPAMQPCKINGQQNFWVRLRLVSGHFGQEVFVSTKAKVQVGTVSPPQLTSLTIDYTYTSSRPLEHYLIENNLEREEITEKLTAAHSSVVFKAMEAETAWYFGFDKKPEKGPVSIFFDIEERDLAGTGDFIEWQYLTNRDEAEKWQRLEALDDTHAFTRAGTVQFNFAPDFAPAQRFGNSLYWIRARGFIDNGSAVRIRGIYLNTVWAEQSATVKDEVLGSSNGSAGQTFNLAKWPAFSCEVWVNEAATLSDGERKALLAAPDQAAKPVVDEKGELQEFWVRWSPDDDLLLSQKDDRHYEADGSAGSICFGNGIAGRIPALGSDNLRASYRTGGGRVGNVDAATITTLKTSVPFVDKVFNPIGASGGTDTEGVASALDRGAHLLRNNLRGVTAEDYEYLVRQAAPGIARVKCLSARDFGTWLPNQEVDRGPGSVLVLIVPSTTEEKPFPSLQLRAQVEEFLKPRIAGAVVAWNRLVVTGPAYVRVSIIASVTACAAEYLPTVEREAQARIRAFLNPLTGGDARAGWGFGRVPFLSDFYAILENLPGVDHVESLRAVLTYDDPHARGVTVLTPESSEILGLKPDELVYSGTHTITVTLPEGGN